MPKPPQQRQIPTNNAKDESLYSFIPEVSSNIHPRLEQWKPTTLRRDGGGSSKNYALELCNEGRTKFALDPRTYANPWERPFALAGTIKTNKMHTQRSRPANAVCVPTRRNGLQPFHHLQTRRRKCRVVWVRLWWGSKEERTC